MSNNVENLVLEHLRALRAGQDRIEAKLAEVTARLTSLEKTSLKSRADNLGTQEDVYRQQTAIDSIVERIDRIERRLELRDS
jgi:hypothetical protein